MRGGMLRCLFAVTAIVQTMVLVRPASPANQAAKPPEERSPFPDFHAPARREPEPLTTVSYPVREITGEPNASGDCPDLDQLIELIVHVVEPYTWDDVGGPCTIAPSEHSSAGAIDVRQTPRGHAGVRALLAELREAGRSEKAKEPEPLGGRTMPPQEGKICQALAQRGNICYAEVPLDHVVRLLEERWKIPIRLDLKALASIPVDEHTPVSLEVVGFSAKTALDLLLARHDMTWVVRDGAVAIVPDDPMQTRAIRAYRVADLTARRRASGDVEHEFGSLIETVAACVRQLWWEEHDYRGLDETDVFAFQAAGTHVLVANQTPANHRRIEAVLAALRAMHRGALLEANGPRPVRWCGNEDFLQALQRKITVDFRDKPLDDVVESLRKTIGIDIFVQREQTLETGPNKRTPVSISSRETPALAVLDRLAAALHLAGTCRDDSFWLTTPDKETEWSEGRVYDVRDLVVGRGTEAWENVQQAVGDGPRRSRGACCFASEDMAALVVFRPRSEQKKIEERLGTLRKSQAGLKLGGSGAVSPAIIPPPPSSSDSEDLPPDGSDKPPPVGRDALCDAAAEGSNRFGLELYRQLGGDPDKNVFFSPSSVAVAMAMTAAGGRGMTADEILKTLRVGMPAEQVHRAFGSLIAAAAGDGSRGYDLHMANRLYVHRAVTPLAPFGRTLHEHYRTDPTPLDFSQPAEARRMVNDWIRQHSRDRVREAVPVDAFGQDGRFMVVSAVDFRGEWAKPFKESATRPGTFRSAGRATQVPMMHRQGSYRYAEAGDVQILEMAYGKNDLSMVILLPQEDPGGLGKFEAAFSWERLQEWLERLKAREVKVYVPRFTLRGDYELTRALREMGVRQAFGPEADFSAIGGRRELVLKWIGHQTFLDVNERETEAAAVTEVKGVFLGAPPPPPQLRIPIFRADHPFVFLIRDNRTGWILFLGRLIHPQ